MNRVLVALTLFPVCLLLWSVIGQSAHPAEYYKCVSAKGQIYVSNVGCPLQSGKVENHQLRETSEQEYQEARRREKAAERTEKAKQEANAQKALAEKLVRAREQCLIEADEAYRTRWDKTCLSNGEAKGCLLNSQIAGNYDRSHTEQRNECYQRYPLR